MLVMGLGEQKSAACKMVQVLEMVIDHDIGGDYCFDAAKNHLLPFDKGKMLVEPLLFFGQALRKFRSGGDDKHLIILIQLAHDVLAMFNDRGGSKEAF